VTVANYFQPESVPEAIGLLADHGPELLVIAGGTIAMPLINEGISLPSQVMGLRRAGLDGINLDGYTMRIGAMVTLTRLGEQYHVPLLATDAGRIAGWSIRNMATVGGNIFAPPPAGDLATALLALDARLTISGAHGERELALADFWTGFMTTSLEPDELLTSISVPLDVEPSAFIKFGRKQANTPSVVTVAVTAGRIALGAVGPHPIRARQAETVLAAGLLDRATIATAADAAAAECDPATDAIATDWYRRRMVRVMVERALTELAAKSKGKEA